jgi:hypothetical protein
VLVLREKVSTIHTFSFNLQYLIERLWLFDKFCIFISNK